MRQVFFLMILIWIFFIFTGCTSSTNQLKAEPGTPSVTSDQAIDIAKATYQVKEIEDITLKHLEQRELELRPTEAYAFTPIYYVISGKDVNDRNVRIYVSSQNPQHHFEFGGNDSFNNIDVTLIASEKKLPQNFDDVAFKRQTAPYYAYLVTKAENKNKYDRLWNDFELTSNNLSVNFSEKNVLFIGIRESSTCPYHLGDVKMNPEGTDLILNLLGPGGVCTADATPRTFVIEVNKEASKNIKDVIIVEGGIKTTVPIG